MIVCVELQQEINLIYSNDFKKMVDARHFYRLENRSLLVQMTIYKSKITKQMPFC